MAQYSSKNLLNTYWHRFSQFQNVGLKPNVFRLAKLCYQRNHYPNAIRGANSFNIQGKEALYEMNKVYLVMV